MEKTGKKFDMNPDTFTLQNLFSMELHNFTETIGEIVGMAMKELSIEKVPQTSHVSEILIPIGRPSWSQIVLDDLQPPFLYQNYSSLLAFVTYFLWFSKSF